MALLSEEEKKKIRRELRARARKKAAWKGAGLKNAPKMSMKGSSVLSKDKVKRKAQTNYITKLGKNPAQKAARKKIVETSRAKGKASPTMKSHVSSTGTKVPKLGKVKPGSMKTGSARKVAKDWRTKHMTKAKTLKGTAKRDAMRKVAKSFKRKIGA